MRRPLLCVLPLAFVACSTSFGTDDGGPDAGPRVVLDLGGVAPDEGSVDEGVEENGIGIDCGSDLDCTGEEVCFADFPGGFCSLFCDPGDPADCPGGTTCVQFDFQTGTSICFPHCDPEAEDTGCRTGGYGCAEGLDPAVCFLGCDEDVDCGGGLACDPEAGNFLGGEGDCFTAGAEVGDACTRGFECTADGFCFSQRRFGFPGGTCVEFGCDAEANTGCDDGAVCIDSFFGPTCFAACSDDDDCRGDYACTESDGRFSCQPAFDVDDLGEVCSAGRGGCPGGACLSETETGYPDSYCVALGCDPEAADEADGCPGDGVCTLDRAGNAFCLDGCQTDGDCRDAYACRPADAANPASPLACVPACTSRGQCAVDAFECNQGTGRCRLPFTDSFLGEPCQDEEPDCPGGLCFDEPSIGWPGGMCTLPGCRLSGEGQRTICPSGAVCVDDGFGDPDLGACVTGCDVDLGIGCRPGYACSAAGPEGQGACVAACEAGGCGPGRTCDTGSGLCVSSDN